MQNCAAPIGQFCFKGSHMNLCVLYDPSMEKSLMAL